MRKKVLITAACLILILTTLPRLGLTHPHVWADYSVEAVFNSQGLEGFRLQWIFDEMFSNEIMGMFNLKGSTLTPAQVRKIKEGAFDNLRSQNYFSQVWIDDKEFQVQFIRDFNARIKDHRVIYEFFVPCTVAATTKPKAVRFQNMDREFFVDFSLPGSQSVSIVNKSGLLVDHEILENRPRSLQIRFRKGP
jgi:ABC-type uncharacterized transport system substrate-binding protein